MMQEPATHFKKYIIAGLVILALAAIAYSNSFNCAFNFDDYHQIQKNQHITSLRNIPGFFADPSAASFRDNKGYRGYRPILMSTFAINYAVSREQVWSYHVLNFILHLLNAFLLFLIIEMVMEASGKKSFWVPFFASLIFAVHPIQTNAVTYISGRSVVLVSTFCLLSFYLFLRFRRAGRYKIIWAFLSPLFFILGLLSKEMAVCLPALVISYDFIFHKEIFRKPKRLLYYAAFILPIFGFLLLRKELLGYASVEESYPRSVYLLSQIKNFLLYLRLMFLPFNQNADYNIPPSTAIDLSALVSFILICLTLAFLFLMRKKLPALSFFGLWMFFAAAPESSIFSILDITVEYRVYLASAGLIGAMLILVSSVKLKPKFFQAAAVTSVILLLMLATFERNKVWATPASLWGDVARKSPDSGRAHANLGEALLEEGRFAESLAELNEVLSLNPTRTRMGIIYTNIGSCYRDMGQSALAEANFMNAIQADPTRVEARVNLGALYSENGKFKDAADVLQEAVKVAPGYARAHHELAIALSNLGYGREAVEENAKAEALIN